MCCTWLSENPGCKNYAKNRHLHTIAQLCRAISSQLRYVSTIGKKNLLNTNISFTSPHNMVNVGPLTAEIGWRVLGTPGNFSGFRVLASLLHRSGATEVNQTLHDVWPSPGLVHYIYVHFWHYLPRNSILPGAYFTLQPSLALSYIDSVTARHSSSGCQPNFATWYLHTTGWPSRSTLGGRTV